MFAVSTAFCVLTADASAVVCTPWWRLGGARAPRPLAPGAGGLLAARLFTPAHAGVA
jgi:hypothetical protein